MSVVLHMMRTQHWLKFLLHVREGSNLAVNNLASTQHRNTRYTHEGSELFEEAKTPARVLCITRLDPYECILKAASNP